MPATVIGGTLVIAGQTAIPGYITESDVQNSEAGEAKEQDVDKADGSLHAKIIFQKMPRRVLTLIATTGTFSEFPEKAMCTVTALSAFLVDSCVRTLTKGEQRAVVTLTNYGIT